MLNREAVKNRINGLIKEYKSDGLGTNLGDAMAEVLKAIEYHNMRLLTYEEISKFDNIPIWIESTDKWLKVDKECEKIGKWFVPSVYNHRITNLQESLPWLWDKKTYGKYWNCYERIL
jgi:hypothetical protein